MSVKEKMVVIKFTHGKDGYWLHFKDSKGKESVINIERIAPSNWIKQWAIDQFSNKDQEGEGENKNAEVAK